MAHPVRTLFTHMLWRRRPWGSDHCHAGRSAKHPHLVRPHISCGCTDLGVLVTAIGRYLPDLLSSGPAALQLTGPFSKVGDYKVTVDYKGGDCGLQGGACMTVDYKGVPAWPVFAIF